MIRPRIDTLPPGPRNAITDVPPDRRQLRRIDLLFRAAAETTEDAVLDALFAAEGVTGRDGHARGALRDLRA